MVGVKQRDQIKNRYTYRCVLTKLADTGDRIVAIPLKQAANMNNVGLQTGKKRLSKQLCSFPASVVARLALSNRTGRMPDTDILLW